MPSAEEEKLNLEGADHAYATAADALRPLTNDRKAFPFIFEELVAYGFNRNACGSRWVGLGVAAMTVVATLLHADTLHLQPPYWTDSGLHAAHVVLLLVSSACAALWCVHFTAETVKLAGSAPALATRAGPRSHHRGTWGRPALQLRRRNGLTT